MTILTTTRPMTNDARRQVRLAALGWRMEYDPKPIPGHDWTWWHVDYEGEYGWSGTAASPAEAMDIMSELIPSPPGAVEQPGQFRFWVSVLKELAGWALLAATGVAFLVLMQWSMEAV